MNVECNLPRNCIVFALNTERVDEHAALQRTLRYHGIHDIPTKAEGMYNSMIETSYVIRASAPVWKLLAKLCQIHRQESIMTVDAQSDATLHYFDPEGIHSEYIGRLTHVTCAVAQRAVGWTRIGDDYFITTND